MTDPVFLPKVNWAKPELPVTPRDTLNGSAVSAVDTQSSIAAENAPLRVIYGQVRLGPLIANVLPYGGGNVVLAVWGHGEVDSVVSYTVDDKAAVTGVTGTHYTGTAGQTVNSTLVSAFAAQSPPITFTDAMPGICYSVFFVPTGASSGFPRLNAIIKGLKVYDPRKDSTNGGTGSHRFATPSTWEWSDNPALCLTNFLTDTVYGCKRTVNWPSVISVANDNDVLASGIEKTRTLNLALETVQPVASWIDTLRTYAGCWVVQSGVDLKLVSDKVRSSVANILHASGHILTLDTLTKRGVQSTPTVMTITYTDTSTLPYKNATAVVKAAGVDAGTTPRRESSVSLPGINRYSQATREATERLNKLLLNDLSFNLGVFDEQLNLEVGDVVSVTHPLGLSAKQMQIMGVAGEYGRYNLSLTEYDPAVYNATVATAPTYTDTDLPSPASPPTPTGVTMVEEVFQLETGIWSSRWRITWSAASYPFLKHYRAELWAGAVLIHTASPTTTEWPTPAVQEGINYTAKVAVVSSIGATSSWATQSATAAGKTLIPGNVPSISAFEAGGTVYVSWEPAVDIDIWRYEVRYGAVATPWAGTILLDRVDSLRLQSDQIPTGTWTLHVKALDSILQYSTTAATVNVTVTSDASAFLVSKYDQTAPTLTNMAEFALARTDSNRYFVSEDGVMASTKFPSTASTYGSIAATYHNSMTSTWLGESEDFGLDLGGNWTGTANVSDISGTHISYLGTAMSATPSTWAYVAGLSQKLNARFARIKHESLTTATLKVVIPEQSIRLDAVPRDEVGTGTSSAAGPVTVTLANVYVACKKLSITPEGVTARSATYDNIVLGSPTTFDVYVFNDSGVKIASAFRYEWQGV